MKLILHVTIVATIRWIVVEGVFHEKSVGKPKPFGAIPDDALFGYSIAYRHSNEQLIVSAPRANSIGKVYQCKEDRNCIDIISEHEIKDTPITNMWLGASVATGPNFTMACAPRATGEVTLNFAKTGTFGKCYVQSTDGKTEQLQSLKVSDRDKVKLEELYMDSFGWALEVDRKNSIIVGGPGMYKGRAIKYSSVSSYPTSIKFPERVEYNFGYSVTSGYFISKQNILLHAVSSPYGQYGEGMVILTNGGPAILWPLPKTTEHTPPVGSLFGASLCAAKLRGEGQSEALLIGASLYPAKGVDVGAVYIYQYDTAKSAADFQFQVVHQKTILGKGDRGQFGSAIINLGDVNGDKRDDVAISAPYENDGRGAVYIYSAADILGDEPAGKVPYLQRLQPEGYSTFGFSMATPKPHKEPCGNLAIGAPVNNTVFIYNCIRKIIVRVLKLKLKDNRRTGTTNFQYEACIEVDYPADDLLPRATLTLNVALTHPTATIQSTKESNTWSTNIITSVERKKEICKDVTIILPEEGSSPQIQYQMSVSQMYPPTESKFFDNTHVLLSDVSVLTLTDTLWVADCATTKCKPVLTFEVGTTLQDGYVIGSTDSESVSVTVHNTGDPAYSSCVRFALSDNVSVRKWPRACQRSGPSAGVCVPDRPIRNQTSWNTGDLKLEMNTLRSDLKQLVFTVYLYEECPPESAGIPLHIEKNITLTTDPRGLVVREYTNYGNVIYLSSDEISETGKQLSHIYTVSNRGFTTWVDIACSIALDKKSFFVEMLVTIDPQTASKCDKVSEKNTSQQYTTKCAVSELKSDQKFDVIVSIYIEPGTLDWKTLENDNITLSSYFKVKFGGKTVDHSITSILRKKESAVPVWVIIVAALVGLFILFLIAFALYECGFLKRKKKEELKKLRRSVHRQSMRRSAQESRRSANKVLNSQSDENKLIEESEDSDPPSPTFSTDGKPLHMADGKKPPIADGKKPPIAVGNKPAMAEEKKPTMPEQVANPMADKLKKPSRTAAEPPQSASDELLKEKHSATAPPQADGEKIKFYRKFGIPGVIGCIDGTLVALKKPVENEERFYCRKGYHARNVQLITDADLNILNVDPTYGGATHDSFIFNYSIIKAHLEALTNAGEEVVLLGDSGYAQRAYLMTPISNAEDNSPEAFYNDRHSTARNSVERTIGLLKGRFRKELIILGLQKNLGKYPVKPPKPRSRETSNDEPEDQEIYGTRP